MIKIYNSYLGLVMVILTSVNKGNNYLQVCRFKISNVKPYRSNSSVFNFTIFYKDKEWDMLPLTEPLPKKKILRIL